MSAGIPPFRYHPAIFERFPTLVGGVVSLTDAQNRPSPPELQQAFLDEQRRVLAKWGEFAPAQIPALAAWRSAFRGFGVEPTKYRCASEALLRRLFKKGDIPGINALVDVCNLISIRYALPMAAFDTRRVQGTLMVRFADGSERFTAHDTPEMEHPEGGEVIFTDDRGLVFARRWCWKQSAESEARPDTECALITIEAHHPGAGQDVHAAIQDLTALLDRYVGGRARPQTYTQSGVV